MRLVDWGAAIDRSGYSPTLFDEIVVLLDGACYELADFRVLAEGGDAGPGLVAVVAGSRLRDTDAQVAEDHKTDSDALGAA